MVLRISFLFLMIFMGTDLFAFLPKIDRYSVSIKDAPVYATLRGERQVKTVPFGMPLSIISEKSGRAQFELEGQLLWISKTHLSPIHFKTFTTSSTFFIPSEVMSTGEMFFIYKNQMYSFNVTNTETKFTSIAKIPDLLDATPSTDRKLWFLLGEVRTDESARLNVGLFDTTRNKFSELTVFSGDVTIELAEFSPDNRYLALFVNKNDATHLYVFDTEQLTLVMKDKDVTGFVWGRSRFLVYHEKSIVMYRLNSWEKIAVKSPEPLSSPSGTKIKNEFLVQNKDKIYVLTNETLVPSKYKSLDRSQDGNFEQYQSANQTITTYKNSRILNLTGQKPRWSFISFIDDRYLLYKQQVDALTKLFRYDAEAKTSQPYYWIEDPYSTFGEGILVDIATEGEQIWIFIESPIAKPKILKLNELL
ncbi:MAG: hypothetical protein ACRCS8_04600 [Brevinema sp.]